MSKKIKSFAVEINGIRYKRVRNGLKGTCSRCDIREYCSSPEIGIPCGWGLDYFIKEQ